MLLWESLSKVSNDEVARWDVASLNLCCAEGLPGTVIESGRYLKQLDNWAERVRQHTAGNAYRFHSQPQCFEHSWPLFCVTDMVTVLQRDLGAHYRQDAIESDDHSFFQTSDNLFIHGILNGQGGTCSSLPPLYVAIGRRLGYAAPILSPRNFVPD